jgi:ABC-type glycerol-3-phosphate transport system substrate-binding protein
MINYSYARDLLQQKASNLNYDIATVPQQDLEGPVVNFSTYWAEVVSKQSKHQQEAWDFLKTITSKPALDKYAAARKLPSSRRDLIELQAIDPDIGVFANANLTAKSFYRPNQQKFDAIISNMIDDVTLRNMEPQEALSKASQQAGELPKGK